MTDPINELRSLNVLVLHPRGADADELIQQINRIGCNVDALWPVPEIMPGNVDLVFAEIRESITAEMQQLLLRREDAPPLVGIIAYENPSVLQGLLDLNVHAVLNRPLRAFGVMSAILMARRSWHELRENIRKQEILAQKLESIHAVTKAKLILMRHHGITEKDAYRIIRNHAMSRRSTTLEVAQGIIGADSLLNDFQPR